MHIFIRILNKEYNMYLMINCIGTYTAYSTKEYRTEITNHMNILEIDLHYYSPTDMNYDVHLPKVV